MTRPYRRPSPVRVFTPEERAAWTVANPAKPKQHVKSFPRETGFSKSIYSGDEPRNRELAEHWQRWPEKRKYKSPPLPKRVAKLKRKDRINKLADKTAYEARLAAPWPLYVSVKEGGH